jgi:hypothetical protein
MDKQEVSMSSDGRSGAVNALLTTVLLSAAFYFARVVLEPIAFALFGIALVWPLLKAMESRMPHAMALLVTILVALVGFLMFVSAIVWSLGDVIHWIFDYLGRFQSLYARITQWLEGRGIFVGDWAGQYDVRSFAGILQQIAMAGGWRCRLEVARNVNLDATLVTIQRGAALILAITRTMEGRLRAASFHPICAKSARPLMGLSLTPHPRYGVNMRENNWERVPLPA